MRSFFLLAFIGMQRAEYKGTLKGMATNYSVIIKNCGSFVLRHILIKQWDGEIKWGITKD